MPQDAFTLRYVARELKEQFTGGKISKITQPAKDCLTLLIYTAKGTVKLDIDLSAKYCRVSCGEEGEVVSPQVAPNFCMLLRKHLQNAEITDVGQIGFERVLFFDLICFSEFEITPMRLYLEIMGKYSNAILTKDGVIVGALKTAALENNAKRVTFTGAKYRLPEKQDKADPTNLEELKTAFCAKSGDAAKFIFEHIAGIAYSTAVDIVRLCGEDVTCEQLFSYVNSPDYVPCVKFEDGRPADFKARKTEDCEERESLLKAQAEYYSHELNKKRFEDRRRKLLSALSSAVKKAEKRLAGIYSKLEECERAEDVKLRGELITANIYAVQRGMTKLEAVNYYDENGGVITIELDPRLTPSQNAQKYFKRYAKLKRTAINLTAQKGENEEKLSYLKSIENNLNSAEVIADLTETEDELISLSLMPAPNVKGKRAAKPEGKFRRYVFDGFTVVCGRNNVQNDKLVRSLAPDDTWLHVKTYHSAHVGILCGGRQPSELCLKLAAEVCAYYSEARGKDKVVVDYTQRRNVKKPKGAGSGFVDYVSYNSILVAPNAHTEDRQDE